MADATVEGIEVEELVADEHEEQTGTVTTATGWPCQQRRKGISTELPAPQPYLDLPIWMSAPARRQVEVEEETV